MYYTYIIKYNKTKKIPFVFATGFILSLHKLN